jgi:hypothetical protein
VEWFDHTIEDMLSKAVRCDQRNWDENFPLLMLAYQNNLLVNTSYYLCKILSRSMKSFKFEASPIKMTLPFWEKVFMEFWKLSNKVSRCSEYKNIAFTPGMMMFGREVELQYPVGSLLWLHDITRNRGLCRKLQIHGKALAK